MESAFVGIYLQNFQFRQIRTEYFWLDLEQFWGTMYVSEIKIALLTLMLLVVREIMVHIFLRSKPDVSNKLERNKNKLKTCLRCDPFILCIPQSILYAIRAFSLNVRAAFDEQNKPFLTTVQLYYL